MDGGKMSLSQTIIYGIVFPLMFFLYVVCLQDRDMFTLNPNIMMFDLYKRKNSKCKCYENK